MSNFKIVLKQALDAYSDCHEEKANERNINFKAELPVTGEEYVRIMKRCVPDGYNAFNEVVAENVRALFGDDSEYWIAREGSVGVYIKPKGKFVQWAQDYLVVANVTDEISYEGNGIF